MGHGRRNQQRARGLITVALREVLPKDIPLNEAQDTFGC
jgi:hypothetical protein